MGVEDSFSYLKEVTPASAGISTLLVNYMKVKCKEDEHTLIENGALDAFIKSTLATKAMWDLVQLKHQKTLLVSFVLSKGKHARKLDQ
jgi:hypothetical protein